MNCRDIITMELQSKMVACYFFSNSAIPRAQNELGQEGGVEKPMNLKGNKGVQVLGGKKNWKNSAAGNINTDCSLENPDDVNLQT